MIYIYHIYICFQYLNNQHIPTTTSSPLMYTTPNLDHPNCERNSNWTLWSISFSSKDFKTSEQMLLPQPKLGEQSSFHFENYFYAFILCACPHVCMQEMGNTELEHGRQRKSSGCSLSTLWVPPGLISGFTTGAFTYWAILPLRSYFKFIYLL